MSEYTDLEKREINELIARIKYSHTTHIKNIDPVTEDMVHLLHHDEHLSSIYGKKRILMASLRKLYIRKQVNDTHKDNHEEIDKREAYIDRRLYEEDMARYPHPSICRRSCATVCTIF
jgi:hypothetical protein